MHRGRRVVQDKSVDSGRSAYINSLRAFESIQIKPFFKIFLIAFDARFVEEGSHG